MCFDLAKKYFFLPRFLRYKGGTNLSKTSHKIQKKSK